MSMKQWWNDTDRGKLKYWDKNFIQCLCLQGRNMNTQVEGWMFMPDIDSTVPNYRPPYTSSA